MLTGLGTAQWTVSLNDLMSGQVRKLGAQIQRNLGAAVAEAVNQSQRNINRLARTVANFGARLRSIGASSIAGGIALGSLFIYPTRAAASFQETLNRFDSIFGNNAKSARAFAEEYGKTVGRSQRQLLGSLSDFASFGKGLRLGTSEAAKFSKSVTQLATDFASFNDLSDDDSINRFISGLSGSSEVFKRFGIDISATALSLRGVGTDATQLQKVMARLAIITEAMGAQGALGDATKTANSATNQYKRFQAAVDDISVAIGNHLLPFLTALLQRINQHIPAIQQWVAENGVMIQRIAALSVVLVTAGGALITFGFIASSVSSILRLLALTVNLTSGAFGLFGKLLGGTGRAIIGTVTLGGKAAKATGSLISTIVKFLFALVAGGGRAVVAAGGFIVRILGGIFSGLGGLTRGLLGIFARLAGGLTGIFGGIGSVFSTVISGIGAAFSGLVSFLGAAFAGLVAIVGSPVTAVVLIVAAVGAAVALLYYKFETFANGLNAIGSGILSFFNGILSSVLGAISSAFGAIYNFLAKITGDIYDGISGAIGGAFDAVVAELPELPSFDLGLDFDTAALDESLAGIDQSIADQKRELQELLNGGFATPDLTAGLNSQLDGLKSERADLQNQRDDIEARKQQLTTEAVNARSAEGLAAIFLNSQRGRNRPGQVLPSQSQGNGAAVVNRQRQAQPVLSFAKTEGLLSQILGRLVPVSLSTIEGHLARIANRLVPFQTQDNASNVAAVVAQPQQLPDLSRLQDGIAAAVKTNTTGAGQQFTAMKQLAADARQIVSLLSDGNSATASGLEELRTSIDGAINQIGTADFQPTTFRTA